jgi:hypothetical protein
VHERAVLGSKFLTFATQKRTREARQLQQLQLAACGAQVHTECSQNLSRKFVIACSIHRFEWLKRST